MSYASRYKNKRKRNGRGDYYGEWTNGRQTTTERINGYTLTYDAGKQRWK